MDEVYKDEVKDLLYAEYWFTHPWNVFHFNPFITTQKRKNNPLEKRH